MGKHSEVSHSTFCKEIRRKRYSEADGMLNPTVKFHIFMTISHFFVCRTTLKSTTLEQQVCSTTQMHYNWQQTVSKEKNVATLYSTHYAKNCATLAVAS